MECVRVKLPGGMGAIVSGRGLKVKPCRWCRAPAPLRCDWKLPGGKTCDKEICSAHAFNAGPEKDLCPAHVIAYRRWLVESQLVPLC